MRNTCQVPNAGAECLWFQPAHTFVQGGVVWVQNPVLGCVQRGLEGAYAGYLVDYVPTCTADDALASAENS